LAKSKCDQAGLGADIVIGVTGTELCPVTVALPANYQGAMMLIPPKQGGKAWGLAQPMRNGQTRMPQAPGSCQRGTCQW